MNVRSPQEMRKLAAGIALPQVSADSGPLGQLQSATLAAPSVGIDPEDARRPFVAAQFERPTPNIPVSLRNAGLHPFAQRVEAAMPEGALTKKQATAIAQCAAELDYPAKCDTEESDIQNAIATAVLDVLSGNRMMFVPPHILTDLMQEAKLEADRFRSEPKPDKKRDTQQLAHNLEKISRKYSKHIQKCGMKHADYVRYRQTLGEQECEPVHE